MMIFHFKRVYELGRSFNKEGAQYSIGLVFCDFKTIMFKCWMRSGIPRIMITNLKGIVQN